MKILKYHKKLLIYIQRYKRQEIIIKLLINIYLVDLMKLLPNKHGLILMESPSVYFHAEKTHKKQVKFPEIFIDQMTRKGNQKSERNRKC